MSSKPPAGQGRREAHNAPRNNLQRTLSQAAATGPYPGQERGLFRVTNNRNLLPLEPVEKNLAFTPEVF